MTLYLSGKQVTTDGNNTDQTPTQSPTREQRRTTDGWSTAGATTFVVPRPNICAPNIFFFLYLAAVDNIPAAAWNPG